MKKFMKNLNNLKNLIFNKAIIVNQTCDITKIYIPIIPKRVGIF